MGGGGGGRKKKEGGKGAKGGGGGGGNYRNAQYIPLNVRMLSSGNMLPRNLSETKALIPIFIAEIRALVLKRTIKTTRGVERLLSQGKGEVGEKSFPSHERKPF